LETLDYLGEGSACEPGEDTAPKPADDEVIVFEEFFVVGFKCHLIQLSRRSFLNIGCICIN
jgi:hypothetical protein